jgi:hypothetical protein
MLQDAIRIGSIHDKALRARIQRLHRSCGVGRAG